LANATTTTNLSDEWTASNIRSIAGGSALRPVIERANDTALCFALREIRHVLEGKPEARALITRAWQIMDTPEVGRTLAIKENSRKVGWWKKPST